MKTPQEYLSCHTDLPYKALIFDCDGTLADTLPVHYQVWSAALQQFQVEMTEEWYYQHAGLSSSELIRTLNETFDYQLDAHAINTDRLFRYQALIDNRSFARYVKEIPAVAEVARSSYGEVPMAVASGGEREIVEAALDAIGLRNYFDAVVTLNDVANGKPAPDVFLLAAEQLGIAPLTVEFTKIVKADWRLPVVPGCLRSTFVCYNNRQHKRTRFYPPPTPLLSVKIVQFLELYNDARPLGQ